MASLSGHPVIRSTGRPADRTTFTDGRRIPTYGEPLSSPASGSGLLAAGLGVARGDRVLILLIAEWLGDGVAW
ncbi:hypothetical protein ACFWFF_17835 [Streptomyces sp. NPDC060223]|uniref:hypothetical protein n=1 Tax=unclassified Streptomyces TaxID=2593676 RepID=UPI00363C7A73